MQISICPSNPPHCFFTKDTKTLCGAPSFPKIGVFFLKILAGPNAPKYQSPKITFEYLVRFCLLAVVTRFGFVID